MISSMEVVATLIIPARLEKLAQVRHFVTSAAVNMPCDQEIIDDIILATDEAVTNIIVHGYEGQEGDISISLCREPDACVVILEDNAPAYDPNDAPQPDINAPLASRPLGGLGVHLIRHLMDELRYQQKSDGTNELTLVKRMKGGHIENEEGNS